MVYCDICLDPIPTGVIYAEPAPEFQTTVFWCDSCHQSLAPARGHADIQPSKTQSNRPHQEG